MLFTEKASVRPLAFFNGSMLLIIPFKVSLVCLICFDKRYCKLLIIDKPYSNIGTTIGIQCDG